MLLSYLYATYICGGENSFLEKFVRCIVGDSWVQKIEFSRSLSSEHEFSHVLADGKSNGRALAEVDAADSLLKAS